MDDLNLCYFSGTVKDYQHEALNTPLGKISFFSLECQTSCFCVVVSEALVGGTILKDGDYIKMIGALRPTRSMRDGKVDASHAVFANEIKILDGEQEKQSVWTFANDSKAIN